MRNFAPANKAKWNSNSLRLQDYINCVSPIGEMAEWSNAPVLKTGVLRGTGGSNPSLSAM